MATQNGIDTETSNEQTSNIEMINSNINASGVWQNTADISWIDTTKQMVAFAFDDGPMGSNSTGTKILDVMQQSKMHCTFFYWGEKINEENKLEIKRAFELGCEVANHTYTHPYLTNLSAGQITEEIAKTNNLLKEVTGQDSHLVRPPYLATNKAVLSAVNAPLITCNVNSLDWQGISKDEIISNVLNNVSDGSILLMHENYESTAQAVEYLVPELVRRGYVIVSVSELAKAKGIEMTCGHVYNKINGADSFDKNKEPVSESGRIIQCEKMVLGGSDTKRIEEPFTGVALYSNDDACKYVQYFTGTSNSFTLKGCSSNGHPAKVDLMIGGEYKGSFYFEGQQLAVSKLDNISHGTGNQQVELVVTSDDGTWDVYLDNLSIS